MAVYPKQFTKGTLEPYAKKRAGKESAPKWRGNIRVGTVTEELDSNGNPVLDEFGKPVTKTTWKTVSKTFSDVECTPYGKGKFRGVREAQAAFNEWRDALIAQDAKRVEEENAATSDEIRMMPVPDLLDAYIDGLVERQEIERSTESTYRPIMKHAKAYFENVRAKDVTPESLEEWKASMAKQGYPPSTRSKAFRLMKQAFGYYAKQLGSNPFEDVRNVTPGKADPNPPDAQSLDQVKSILEHSAPDAFHTAIGLALRTGMREGEICGLRWRDVDPETGAITVQNAIARKGGARCYQKGPKGRNGQITRRNIPGSPKIKQMLDARRTQMRKEAKTVGQRWSDDLFVVGKVDGTFYNPTMLYRKWMGLADGVGLRGTKGRTPVFHDLRHTYATQALHARIDPVTVASIMGHKDPKLTMTVYADAMPEAKQAAAMTMDDVL